jgi:hypothetical protein
MYCLRRTATLLLISAVLLAACTPPGAAPDPKMSTASPVPTPSPTTGEVSHPSPPKAFGGGWPDWCRADLLEPMFLPSHGEPAEALRALCSLRWTLPGGLMVEVRPWHDSPTSPWTADQAHRGVLESEPLRLGWTGWMGTYPGLRYSAPLMEKTGAPFFGPHDWVAAVAGTKGGLILVCTTERLAVTPKEGTQFQELVDDRCPAILADTRVGDLGEPIPPLGSHTEISVASIAPEQIRYIEISTSGGHHFLSPEGLETALFRLLDTLQQAPQIWRAHNFEHRLTVNLRLDSYGGISLYHSGGNAVEVYSDEGSFAVRSTELVAAMQEIANNPPPADLGLPVRGLPTPVTLLDSGVDHYLMGAALLHDELHIFFRQGSEGAAQVLNQTTGYSTSLQTLFPLAPDNALSVGPLGGSEGLLLGIGGGAGHSPGLWTVTAGEVHRLAEGFWGEVIADGRLFYWRHDGVWQRDSLGTTTRLFAPFGLGLGPVSASPDGSLIAYTWGISDGNGLWLYDVARQRHMPIHMDWGVSGITWVDDQRLLYRSMGGIACVHFGTDRPMVRYLDLPGSVAERPFALAGDWLVYQTDSQATQAINAVQLDWATLCKTP